MGKQKASVQVKKNKVFVRGEDKSKGRKNGKERKKSKGARWEKGNSCESNPTVRKFRDANSSLHFPLHNIGENALLTEDILQTKRDEEMEDEYDVLSDDVRSLTVSDARSFRSFRSGTGTTCKTFASGWSKCSNQAFERFLGRFKVDSALHKEMLSVLAATTEVINSFGGKHTDTEYFATFISVLDGCEPNQYHPVMALLCMIIGKVPEGVIKKKFPDIYPKMSKIFTSALENNEHTLIRLCCNALGKILKTQDFVVTETDSSESCSAYYSILKCCLSDNPKVRRKARQVIGGLLNKENGKGNSNLFKLIFGWILDQLGAYPTCGAKVAADTLGLLQFTWNFVIEISSSAAKKIFESVLRVVSGGDAGIVKIGFSLFSTVFQKGVGLLPDPGKQQEEALGLKLMCVLYELRPDWRNNDAFTCWSKCILDGILRGVQDDWEKSYEYMPLVLDYACQTFTSAYGAVLAKLLCEYVPTIISDAAPTEVLQDVFKKLSKNLISIPPNSNCLNVVNSLLDSLNQNQFNVAAKEIYYQLVPLFNHSSADVSKTLGKYVKAFGVEQLWKCSDGSTQRTVLLPLLKDNLSNANFQFWIGCIQPLAQGDAKENTKLTTWESLVGFCRNPASVDNFPAQLVGQTIVTQPEFRLPALAAVRQLMLWPQAKSFLEKRSKNYVPLLFQLYIKELVKCNSENKPDYTGHPQAILLTIEQYLKFCDESFVLELLNRAVTKFTSFGEQKNDEKLPLLDLIGVLACEHAPAEELEKLLGIASSLLSDAKTQKRGYRILHALVKNNSLSKSCFDKILALVKQNQGSAKTNAEALRLECIITITEKEQSLTKEFLPEAVLNLLSVNAKTRKIAVQYCKVSCERLQNLDSLMEVIRIGLQASTPFVRACTVNFITLAYVELQPKQPIKELTDACLELLNGMSTPASVPSSEIAILRKECLAFVSINLSLFKSLMGPYASTIGNILSMPGNPRREMNKILARMIKVFGVAGLKAVMPNSGEAKMHTRIKNLQKKIRKLKEEKSKKLTNQDDYDAAVRGSKKEDDLESSDDDDDLVGTTKKTKSGKGLVIKEGMVDFLDTKNVAGALIVKPKPVSAEEAFKVSEEGKIIIEMEDEMKKSKAVIGKKRKGTSVSNASYIEDDDDDDEELFNSRRERSDTRSVKSMKSSKSSASSRKFAMKRPKKARL